MGSKLYYVYDEGALRHYSNLEEAREDAEYQIEICRENCDPEWPMSTEYISVYECDQETEYPEEDGVCVLTATMVDIREPDDGDKSVEFYCDYAMKPPSGRAALEQDHDKA